MLWLTSARSLVRFVASFALFGLAAAASQAANFTWDASGNGSQLDGGGTWDTTNAHFWNGSADFIWSNANNDTAIFGAGTGAAGTVNLGTGITAGGLTFNPAGSGNYTIGGTSVLTLGGSTPTITTNVDATIAAPIAGASGLTKSGTGTLVLSANNTYAGTTAITGGTLRLSGGYRYYQFRVTSLNNNATANSVQLAEVMYFNSSGTRVAATTVTNPGGNNPGNEGPANANDNNLGSKWLDFNKGGTLGSTSDLGLIYDFGAPIALPQYNLATANDSQERDPTGWTIAGSNDGTNFTILDTRTGIADPAARNTWYNGGQTNTYSINLATNQLPVGTAVTISSNSTLDLNGVSATINSLSDAAGSPTGSRVLMGGATLTTGADNSSTTFSGVISGAGTLNKTGTGNFSLAGANTFTGATNINNGSITLANSLAMQNSTVTVGLNNGLKFSGGLSSASIGALAGTGNIALADSGNAAVAVTVGSNNASTSYSGNLSGAGSLTKTGSGTLNLSGNNSYGGTTFLSGGTLKLSGAFRYYQFRVTSLNNNGAANSVQLSEVMYFNPSGTRVAATTVTNPGGNNPGTEGPANANDNNLTTKWLDFNKGGTLGSQSDLGLIYDFGSPILLNQYNLATANDSQERDPTGWTIAGSNDGTNFTIIDTQTNIADPAARQTWYNGGQNNTFHITFPSVLPTGNAVVIASNSTLDLNGIGSSLGSLSDAAPNATGSQVLLGLATLTVGSANTSTAFSGAISGSGGLSKIGNGTLTLNGALSYTGPTIVSGGTLRLASTGSIGNTAISVNNTGTLQVRPSTGATIAAGATSSLAVASGGSFDMSGDGQAGTFRVGGTLSLGNTSVLGFDIGTSGTTTVVDSLVALGAANDTGTTTINISGFGSNSLTNGLYPIITVASGLQTGAFTLGASTVNVNGVNYALALIPSATQEFLRVTAPALNGSWIQTGATPPTYSWGDGSNWQSGVIPGNAIGSGDTASFGSANGNQQTVTLDKNRNIGVLTFSNSGGGNYTISGNGFTLNLDGGGAGALVTNSTSSNLLSGPVQLVDNTIVNAAASTSITFGGAVSGAKSITVNTLGSGTVVLNNTNSFSGGLTVAGGTVQVPTLNNVSTPGPLGNNSSVTLGALGGLTGTIEYAGVGNVTTSMPLSLVGGGGGGLTVDDGGSVVTLGGNVTTSGAGTATFAVGGSGTVALSGAGNSFAGGLNINGGTVRDANSAAGTLGSGVVSFGSTGAPTLDLNGNSPTVGQLSGSGVNGVVTNGSGSLSTLTLNGSGTSTYNGAINGGANVALVVTGGGTQLLGGTSNFSGGLAIQNGTVQVTSNSAIGSTNAITLGSGTNSGALVLGSGGTAVSVSAPSVSTSGSGSTNRVVGGATTVSTLNLSAASPVVLNAPLFGGTGANQNNLAVNFAGAGPITASASMGYTGGSTITGSTINVTPRAASTSPFGTGTLTLAGSTLNLQGQGALTGGAGLTANLYNNTPGNTNNSDPAYASLSALNAHLTTLGAATVSTSTTTGGKADLNFSNANYGNNAPFNAAGTDTAAYGFTNNTNYETAFQGYIYINTGGAYAFSTTSDDGSAIWIDNNDTAVVNNNFFQGATKRSGTVNLTPGFHAITVGFYQGGGGQGLLVQYDGPDTGALNPTAGNTTVSNAVLYPTASGSPQVNFGATQTLSNAIAVTADSTVNITGSPNASVGALTIGANTLNVTSTDNNSNSFGLTTGSLRLNGSATFNVTSSSGGGAGSMTVGGAVLDNGQNYGITKAGPGTLTLSSPGSYGGGTTVNAGTVVASQPGALGSGAVTLNNSATLRVIANASGFINGFNGGVGWGTPNGYGNAQSFSGNTLTLTDSNNSEARSVFFGTQQAIQIGSAGFTASFTYTPSNLASPADGAAFVLQNDPRGLSALGAAGGSLGYGGQNTIANSAAFEINVYPTSNGGHTVGTIFVPNSTPNGVASGTTGTYNATGSVNFGSGDPINVTLVYNPVNHTIFETDVDTSNNASFTTTYTGVDLSAALGGTTAYVGFTGGTGGLNVTQVVSNFNYNIGTPQSTYSNDVHLTGGATARIDVAPTSSLSTVTMGALQVGSGGAATLNVTGATAPASYGLTLGAVTLNSDLVVTVANNGSGVGTVTLGATGPTSHSLTAAGPGVVVLSGANLHTGSTSVTGGTLRLASSASTNNIAASPSVSVGSGATLDVTGLQNSTFVVANGQTLSGAGTVHGSVTVGDGSVPPGAAPTIASASGSTLTIDGVTGPGLTLSDNSIARFTLSGTPGGSGVNPMIAIGSGGLVLNTTSTVQLTGTPVVGTYDLFSFPNGSGPGGGLTISNLTGNSSLSYSLAYLAHEVDLIVSNPATSATWNVNGDGNYNVAGNWSTNGTSQGVPTGPTLTATFGNGDTVPVTGSPNAINVTVNANVTAGHLQFNNTTGVTYNLASDGSHSVSLNNSGGTATIDVSTSATIQANLVLADSQGTTITVIDGKTLDISGVISGAAGANGLIKAGLGTLTIDMPSTYTGATTVNAGTLRTTMSGLIGGGDLVVNNSGTVAEFGNIGHVAPAPQTVSSLSGNGGTVVVDGGVTLVVNQAASTSFAGDIKLDVGGSTLTKSGSGHLTVSGNIAIGDSAVVDVSSDVNGTNKLTLADPGGSGSGMIGTNVQVSVGSGATLELAGSSPALGTSNVTHRAHVIDNGSLIAVTGLGEGEQTQIVGGVDGGDTTTSGAGSVSVTTNAALQADHVLVDSISIGNGGLLTLAPSKTDGSPATSLGGSGSSLGLSHLLASRSLLARHSFSNLGSGAVSSGSLSSLSSGSLGGTAAVPEPSTVVLLAIGALCGAKLALRRRVRG